MKVKAIQDFKGSLNGFEVIDIAQGTVLDVDDQTAGIFLAAGFCEPVIDSHKAKKSHAD